MYYLGLIIITMNIIIHGNCYTNKQSKYNTYRLRVLFLERLPPESGDPVISGR